MPISLHVKVTVAPENVSKFLEHFKAAWSAVTAEPECLFFEVYQDPSQPGAFKWVENWDATVEWLVDVQLKKEYYKPYFAATEPMFIKPREHEIWQTGEGTEWFHVKKDFYFPTS